MFKKLLCSYKQPIMPELSQDDCLCVDVYLDYQTPDTTPRSYLLIDYYVQSKNLTFYDRSNDATTIGLYVDGKKIISTSGSSLMRMQLGKQCVILAQEKVFIDHDNDTIIDGEVYYWKYPHFRAILNPSSSMSVRTADGAEYSLNNKDIVIEFDLAELPMINDTKALIVNAPVMYDRNLYTLWYSCVIGIDPYKPDGTVISNDLYASIKAWVEIDGYRYFERNLPVAEQFYSGADYLRYDFNITDEELQPVRALMYDKSELPVTLVIESCDKATMTYYYDSVEIEYKIVHDYPIISDITIESENLLHLTGDKNIFVKGYSNAHYNFKATALKEATIKAASVRNGKLVSSGWLQYYFGPITEPDFYITVTDSRGLETQRKITKPFVPYLNPTCYQKITGHIRDEVGIHFSVTIFGDAFNGSFGAVDNDLQIYIKHTQADGTMGDWVELTESIEPELEGNTYKLNATLTNTNLSYQGSYTLQSMLVDKLNTVISSTTTISIEPMFDWSNEDFNFNVPINMHEETVLRHNRTDNHTILSASGGRIHFRPNGTNDEYGEAILHDDGSIEVLGHTISSLGDYVIETGTEAMGTNGIWYWTKWASGKAECYGMRNFGNMAITTAWGGLYRGAAISQDLPNRLFIQTPEVIDINLINSNYGGWIARHETTAPSKSTTGSFIIVRPASATITPTNIGFNIIGRWKELEEE